MVKKIKNYVEQIFEESPKTKKSSELRDELVANLIEKYNDLIVKGKSEEEAYNIVIESIGDISELVGNLHEEDVFSLMYQEKERKKQAKNIAIAVMLYILSVVPVIYFDMAWAMAEFGVIMMFFMVAAATGLLVYTGVSKSKYTKENETLVEEFKEWKSKKSQRKSFENAIMSAFWTFIVAVYLIISFLFQIWSYSWIIFIIAAAVSQIIKAIFEIRGE